MGRRDGAHRHRGGLRQRHRARVPFRPGGITTLRAELRDDRLEIEVRDHGGWRKSDSGAGTDRGRGRLIMARVMDEATIVGTPEGTTVRLVKRLSGDR